MAIYKRDIASINLETGTIHRTFLNHSIGYKDQKADHFGIRVFRDGEPVNLTGVSVQGVFMPPQGDPIAITSGNIVSGNVAEVVLPQACYNYDGQFCLAIKLVDSNNSVTGTMRIVDGMVDNTHASGTVAPTSAVPTYQEILSTYDAMVAATAAANGAIAPLYANLTFPVKVGQYAIVDGALKRAIVDIATSEAYTAAHWTDAKIGPDVSDLKSAISKRIDETYPQLRTVVGEMNLVIGGGVAPTTGGNTNGSGLARISAAKALGEPLMVYMDSTEYQYVIWCYSGTGTGSATESPTEKQYTTEKVVVSNKGNNNYFKIGFKRLDGADMTSGADDPTKDEYKILHALRLCYMTDTTMTKKGIPADAKAVGDLMQTKLTFDTKPTENSTNPVTSGGLFLRALLPAGTIPSGSDIDDYKNIGVYAVSTSGIADSLDNWPLGKQIGQLIVNAHRESGSEASLGISQLVIGQFDMYARYWAGSVWSNWLPINTSEYGYLGSNTARLKPCYDHLFVQNTENIVIPHESVYHIRVSKKFGFDVIELNTAKTSDGVYVVNHFANYKFGPFFHHVDNETDISDVAVSSVTWAWIQENVRYNSTIPKFRTAPSRLEETLAECRQQNLIPLVMVNNEPAVLEIADKIMGKDNYIAYKATRSICPTAMIYQWASYDSLEDILAYCQGFGRPFIYGMSNPGSFTDEELREIIDALHAEGYLIGVSYDPGASGWYKYSAMGFDVNGAIHRINRIQNGNICNFDTMFSYNDFTVTGATESNGVLTFTSNGTIIPNVDNTVYDLAGIDIEIVFNGRIIISSIGEYEAHAFYSDGSYPVFHAIPIVNGNVKAQIKPDSGTTVSHIAFRASQF